MGVVETTPRLNFLSLTTIGAPHRGTPLADLGTQVLGEMLGLHWIPLLRPSPSFLAERVGENDDLVSASSQRWGEVLGTGRRSAGPGSSTRPPSTPSCRASSAAAGSDVWGPHAAEYCIAVYRTPRDWRASWPIRSLTDELGSCQPPYGGVEDEDFGREVFIFGFAHNHPCGTAHPSNPDLEVFPMVKMVDGTWTMVAYAASPAGKVAIDSRGQPIPAWTWLATSHLNDPRFYKWNHSGEVYKWSEPKKQWEFQATCVPQRSNMRGPGAGRPKCTPELK